MYRVTVAANLQGEMNLKVAEEVELALVALSEQYGLELSLRSGMKVAQKASPPQLRRSLLNAISSREKELRIKAWETAGQVLRCTHCAKEINYSGEKFESWKMRRRCQSCQGLPTGDTQHCGGCGKIIMFAEFLRWRGTRYTEKSSWRTVSRCADCFGLPIVRAAIQEYSDLYRSDSVLQQLRIKLQNIFLP